MEDAAPTCDVMLVTNGDNIYASAFFTEALAELNRGFDLVATHWVSRYNMSEEWQWISVRQRKCGARRTGMFQEFRTAFKRYCVDLGAVVFKTSVLQQTPLRFFVDELRQGKPAKRWRTTQHENRDGLFFEKAAKLFNTSIVQQALFMHQ